MSRLAECDRGPTWGRTDNHYRASAELVRALLSGGSLEIVGG